MEIESGVTIGELSMTQGATSEIDSRARIGVRRWLEEAWRHGEIVADDDGLETNEPARRPNRFEVSRREAEAPARDVMH